jgi:hypothetical protein
MKFNTQREVLSIIKRIFVEEAAGGSGLSIAGLQRAMSQLHTPLEK